MSHEQDVIVAGPPALRVAVLAAAGTGKTEVVVRRLAWLVANKGLLPGRDLLVLSFSRAAVGEVHRRLRAIDPSLASMRVATFDSFATRLLAEHATDDGWSTESFDGRIRAATALIDASADVRAVLADHRHVIVDEVQDLVGDRADFIHKILGVLPSTAGFTVLGDPAQSIYEFQLVESVSKTTARGLLRRLLELSPPPLVLTLDENHRASSPTAGRVERYGARIREAVLADGEPPTDLRRLIEDDLYRLPVYDSTVTARLLQQRGSEGLSGAVLCRFNGQALVVSRALNGLGLPHRLQQAAEDRPAAAWIARAFGGYRFSAMSRSQFDASLVDLDVPHPEPDEAWRAVKRLDWRQVKELSLEHVRAGVAGRRLDDELVTIPATDVVVSTVHRAKGLEWDVVGLCGLEEIVDEPFADARLLYVAMTRTRDELFVLPAPDTVGMSSKEQPDGRWVRRSPNRRRLVSMELLAGDVHTLDPAGTYMIEADAAELQSHLAAEVKPSDEVRLELIRSSVDGQPRAVYRVDHEKRPIGVTSDAFARAVWNNVAEGGRLDSGFPRLLTGARVYCIETVCGSSVAGQRALLGASGLWLAPRLHGLAEVCWEESA